MSLMPPSAWVPAVFFRLLNMTRLNCEMSCHTSARRRLLLVTLVYSLLLTTLNAYLPVDSLALETDRMALSHVQPQLT